MTEHTEVSSDAPAEPLHKIEPGFWSHVETSVYLGLPEATLHALNYKGKGPRSYKIGRHRKYKPSDVLAWCESRASDHPAPAA